MTDERWRWKIQWLDKLHALIVLTTVDAEILAYYRHEPELRVRRAGARGHDGLVVGVDGLVVGVDGLVVGVGGLTRTVNVAVAVCAGDSLSVTVTVAL